MSHHATTQVALGLGSPNGDDQFGWTVIDELCQLGVNAELHKLRHPVDILPWLDCAAQVHIVDAAIGVAEGGSLEYLEFSNVQHRKRIQEIPCCGTHDMGLYFVLMMAQSLGKPTDHVSMWLGRAEQFQPMSCMSPATMESRRACVLQLCRRLGRARSLIG